MTFDGDVVFVCCPCPAFVESEFVELGIVGVPPVDDGGVVSVVPVGVPDVSGLLPVLVPLPVALVADGDVDELVESLLDGDVEPVDDGDPLTEELPVAGVVDGFDIELSVVGLSVLLHAPSAARVAAMARIRMERCMATPVEVLAAD